MRANTHRIVPKAEILVVYVLFLNKGDKEVSSGKLKY